MAGGDIKTMNPIHAHCTAMPEPDTFALIITSTLLSVGVFSALSQISVVLTLYGKYGLWVEVQPSGYIVFRYLSDTFVMDPGKANTWLIAMIPSVAIAAIVINTSTRRDIKKLRDGGGSCQYAPSLIALWFTVCTTQTGLIMLVLYNIVENFGLHVVGVSLCLVGAFVLNAWVIVLDHRVTRRRWHPQIVFDVTLIFVTIISIVLFFQPILNLSVVGEWVLLTGMMVSHTLLPFRGARIVLAKA
jgi:hypothetical protein